METDRDPSDLGLPWLPDPDEVDDEPPVPVPRRPVEADVPSGPPAAESTRRDAVAGFARQRGRVSESGRLARECECGAAVGQWCRRSFGFVHQYR